MDYLGSAVWLSAIGDEPVDAIGLVNDIRREDRVGECGRVVAKERSVVLSDLLGLGVEETCRVDVLEGEGEEGDDSEGAGEHDCCWKGMRLSEGDAKECCMLNVQVEYSSTFLYPTHLERNDSLLP